MKYIVVLLISYLLGSIPFGLIVTKLWAKMDVREYGSGNIGMTNVLRTAGQFCAVITLIGDVGKGVAAVLLAKHYIGTPNFNLIAGLFAVFGHNWSLFLGFKGGKGVATIAGVLVSYKPIVVVFLLVIWLGVLLVSRYISLASIIAAACLPIVLVFLKSSVFEICTAIVLAVFTIIRHKSNIERLRQGTEFRFGQKVN